MPPKKTSTKKKKIVKNAMDKIDWKCTRCGTGDKTKFYQSVNEVHKYTGYFPICKECMSIE